MGHQEVIEIPQQIKIKKLHPDAKLPTRAHEDDAAWDLYAIQGDSIYDRPLAVGTGLAFEIPPGWEMQIRPRSGLAAKHGLTVVNSPGTIDSGFRGEVKVILASLDPPYEFAKGDRIAQAVFQRVPTVELIDVGDDELSPSSRGTGGFGSSGR